MISGGEQIGLVLQNHLFELSLFIKALIKLKGNFNLATKADDYRPFQVVLLKDFFSNLHVPLWVSRREMPCLKWL